MTWTEANAGIQEFLTDLAERAGIEWFDYQWDTFEAEENSSEPLRVCLYYRTGAGKSLTALGLLAMWGCSDALVVAPPSTHAAWEKWAAKLGIGVECVSHAKFRMKDFKIDRSKAIIADEMHMFGGQKGKGWKKLDAAARGLKAPMILASATPNYNDAERVYCVKHILDPHNTKGGYLAFLYQHCETEPNQFAQEPIVTGFLNYPDAEAFLRDLPHVHFVPDNVSYTIEDVTIQVPYDADFETLGYDRNIHRIMASIIEAKHRRIFKALVEEPASDLRSSATKAVLDILKNSKGPLLVYADHSTVARSTYFTFSRMKHFRIGLVTGDTAKKKKEEIIESFRSGDLDMLIGTASLATGTDGLDKVCDTLIILDDTDDGSLRKQLIGRIMPRGADADASSKRVFRFVPVWT